MKSTDSSEADTLATDAAVALFQKNNMCQLIKG